VALKGNPVLIQRSIWVPSLLPEVQNSYLFRPKNKISDRYYFNITKMINKLNSIVRMRFLLLLGKIFTCILHVLCETVGLLFSLERGELQTQRAAVLIGKEIIELWSVRVEPGDEILGAVQLDCGDSLA